MKNLIEKFFDLFRKKKKNNWLETTGRDVANPKNPIPLDPNAPWNT